MWTRYNSKLIVPKKPMTFEIRPRIKSNILINNIMLPGTIITKQKLNKYSKLKAFIKTKSNTPIPNKKINKFDLSKSLFLNAKNAPKKKMGIRVTNNIIGACMSPWFVIIETYVKTILIKKHENNEKYGLLIRLLYKNGKNI